MKVKLSYFKLTGKWYADTEYEAVEDRAFSHICSDVRRMLDDSKLPGLLEHRLCLECGWRSPYDLMVLVLVPGLGPGRIIMPRERA